MSVEVWKKCGENSVEVCKIVWSLDAKISTPFDIKLHIKPVWRCVEMRQKCGRKCGGNSVEVWKKVWMCVE